ncbi:hypothetical protein C2857_006137 [Epichloe festucae Fl1]|uniref:Uncharacterized protein n=1 Tax=Epichloe festucae (strain Fl1) TaxID=877507 RepID=A0A7S9KPW6_EPIFF|nr:hypothetical protein C2857_006137 [Epichloe festucae Fl1]
MEGALNLGNTVTVRRRHGMDGSIPENKARRELRHCLPTSANSENEIGVPYILMSKATGDHLSTYDWPTHNLAYPNRIGHFALLFLILSCCPPLPGLPHPRDLLTDHASVSAFRNAFEEGCSKCQSVRPSEKEWEAGELLSYLIRLVNLDALQDFHHLEALYQLATSPAKDENIRATLAFMSAESEARLLSATLAEDDDEPEHEVRLQENEYFCRYKRLWRWIDETRRWENAQRGGAYQTPPRVSDEHSDN